MTRMDWAVDLFWWFEYWSKGNGVMPELHVQMQRHDGRWHVEDTWPPEDMYWEEITLDQATATGSSVSATSSVTVTIPASENDRFISGLPTLHLSASTGFCDGGQVFATMFDATKTSDLVMQQWMLDIEMADMKQKQLHLSPLTTCKWNSIQWT